MEKKTKLRFGVKERYVPKPTYGYGMTYIMEQIRKTVGKSLNEQTSTHQHLEK